MYRFFKILIAGILSVASIMIITTCRRFTLPAVATISVTNITQVSAQSGGVITDDGGSEIIECGICWSTEMNPTLASSKTKDVAGSGSFISVMTGLNVNTRYYVRAYASNSEGIAYGNDNSFITRPIELAAISTLSVTSITPATAELGGNISFDGGTDIIDRGVCWSTGQNPTTNDLKVSLGTGTGSFSTIVNCLSYATTYYVRSYALNSAGIAYGDQQYFTTSGTNPIVFNSEITYGSVPDIDGNCYKTIQIGTQTWMAENLRTSRYNDGTTIPCITDVSEWSSLLEELPGGTYKTTGAYCWYNNDSADYENGYGKLYNFGTVYSGKLCPVGWHVPRYFDIGVSGSPSEECYNYGYLGGAQMETGLNHWINPHSSCISNQTGFTAIPGGRRNSDGTFIGLGLNAYFWTSGWAGHGPLVIYFMLPHSPYFGNSPMSCSVYPTAGLSVRCVKD